MRLKVPENYIGQKFGKLKITNDLGCISAGKRRIVTAICDCGVVKNYLVSRLKKGDTKSCGCILKEIRYGIEFINKTIITDDSRMCVSCKLIKPNSEYHRSGKKIGLQSKCKECTAMYKKERYWANHDVELAKMTKSRLKPDNQIQRRGYYQKNKDEYRERYLNLISDQTKKKSRKDKDKEYRKKRYRTDPEYNILIKIRARIRSELNGKRQGKLKNKTTLSYIGCSYTFFKEYIESKFTTGMTWDGVLNGEIHLDHIRPCSSFVLTDPEQQKICFNWKNVQPLWELDNLRKNASYNEESAL